MQKRITKNLTLKILAFLIAVFLWLIVVNIDDPVDDKTFSNIPVQVTHVIHPLISGFSARSSSNFDRVPSLFTSSEDVVSSTPRVG